MTTTERDVAELIFVIFSTAVGLVGCVYVYRNENRRRLRQRLRDIIETTLPPAENLERQLANEIGEALRNQNAISLEKLTLAPFLQDYIVDLEFKPRLYSFLLDYVKKHRLKLSPEQFQKILSVMDIWKEVDNDLEGEILNSLKQIPQPEKGVRDLQRFLHSRDRYFADTTNKFVDDVQDVVRTVAASS